MKWLLLFSFLWISPAGAYVRTMSDSGLPLFWSPARPLIYLNPSNQTELDSNQINTMMQASLQSWNNTGANVSFTLQSAANIPPVSGYDNANTIYFTSQSNRKLGWGVIAVTEVLYYISSGQIVEFDMAFNDDNYFFTNQEGDTGRPSNSGKTKIFFKDVATHESGHAFGLDHTQVGRSAMIYTAFNGQFSLGNDDNTAIQTIYPGTSGGSISGTVYGTQGGILGTHILAINAVSGKVQAGTLANDNGQFSIGALPDGDYFLLMEPFLPSTSSVSSYWKNTNHRFCGGSKFRRTFFSPCGQSDLNILSIRNGQSASAGILSPQCNQMGNPNGAPNSIQNARSISSQGGAVFGTLNPGESHYYRIQPANGSTFLARALAYSLYSPLDLRLEFLQSNGQALAGAILEDNVEQPMPGGVNNYDAAARVLANGESIIVKVTAANLRLSNSLYPAGFDLLDSSGHYALSFSINNQVTALNNSDMSACVSVVNNPQSASFNRSPASENINTGAGCGSIDTGGSGPTTGGGALALALAGLVFGSSRLARRYSRR